MKMRGLSSGGWDGIGYSFPASSVFVPCESGPGNWGDNHLFYHGRAPACSCGDGHSALPVSWGSLVGPRLTLASPSYCSS